MSKDAKPKPVTTITHNDIKNLMNPGTELRQPMQGFDPDYVDIVDYIVRCTHKIWEEGAAGLVYTHYSHHATMFTADSFVYGREDWVNIPFRHRPPILIASPSRTM